MQGLPANVLFFADDDVHERKGAGLVALPGYFHDECNMTGVPHQFFTSQRADLSSDCDITSNWMFEANNQ